MQVAIWHLVEWRRHRQQNRINRRNWVDIKATSASWRIYFTPLWHSQEGSHYGSDAWTTKWRVQIWEWDGKRKARSILGEEPHRNVFNFADGQQDYRWRTYHISVAVTCSPPVAVITFCPQAQVGKIIEARNVVKRPTMERSVRKEAVNDLIVVDLINRLTLKHSHIEHQPSRKNFMMNSMEKFGEIMKQTNIEMERELERMPIGKFQ